MRGLASLTAALTVSWAAAAVAAPSPAAMDVAKAFKPLMAPASNGPMMADWQSIEVAKAIRWGQGPIMLDKPSPAGDYFARPGQMIIQGAPAMVIASGARTMVFNIYVRAPGPALAPPDIEDSFRQAGFGVSLTRCPAPGRAAPKRWYTLTLPGKSPAFLYAGPLASGGQGYTLILGGEMPTMTQAEAGLYTDSCAGAGASARPGAPASPAMTSQAMTGQAGVAAFIEAAMRPVGAPTTLPWSSLPSLPIAAWKSAAPMKMRSPYTDGGEDLNPRILEADFKTATTRMNVLATGDERGANRFSLRDGGNLPPGAVFAQLVRDGYAIAPIRCGKRYTQMSDGFFRLSGPGKQPAILYRAVYQDPGRTSESYGLRLDNVMPPMVPGQSAPVGGRCPA